MNKQHLTEWWKKNSKTVITIVISFIGALIAAVTGVTTLTSCGSTVKALVQSPKDSATTTITITTNNPTQVSPETNIPTSITPKQ